MTAASRSLPINRIGTSNTNKNRYYFYLHFSTISWFRHYLAEGPLLDRHYCFRHIPLPPVAGSATTARVLGGGYTTGPLGPPSPPLLLPPHSAIAGRRFRHYLAEGTLLDP
jgi:hypothetical protein